MNQTPYTLKKKEDIKTKSNYQPKHVLFSPRHQLT